MFIERTVGERIHWSLGHGSKTEWYRKISEIKSGSLVGLRTDEDDLVKINIIGNDDGNFTGTVVDIQPDPPISECIADIRVGSEVSFCESNLINVFSVLK